MMNNFLEFIIKDIEVKKTLLTNSPTKTKTNRKKYNQLIEEIKKKYIDYQSGIKNYLLAKSKSLNIAEDEENIEKITKRVENYEHVKFLLNPSNTYFEKMGFDDLLYQLNNYYVFNFKSLNEIINGFLDKFELVGIRLENDDFDYTCYVHEYMSSFLEVRYKKQNSYDKVSEIFEQIYWMNPELISHIELNFRKLIKKNAKKFNSYITSLQKEAMNKNNIDNYAICLERLQDAYIDLNMRTKENITDIISLAKNNEINIEQYLPENKVRKTAFISLIPDEISFDDKENMTKICAALEKLKLNVEEYINYLKFKPLFNKFKQIYEPLLPSQDKKTEYKGLKEIEDKIEEKENELEKLNKKIFSGRPGFFEFKNDNDLKQLKVESVYKAKELYDLYKKYDEEYFKDKVMKILDHTMSVSDLLNLYFSFDYFKKLEIQKVYNVDNYNDIIKYSEEFDLFAMNPTNVIITGIPVFTDVDIAKIICNKYRLNNLKLTEADLSSDNLKQLLTKILLILRVDKIENSKTSIDKIWFMVEVEKIINKEKTNDL